MTVVHICPYCQKRLTQRTLGRSIDKGCPECKPELWPRREV